MSKTLRYFVVFILISLAALAVTYFLLKDNIHTVIPNQIYRSAQLPPEKLTALIQAKHIKSILNLRGDNMKQEWYQHELAISQTLQVQHYDLALRAYRLPAWQSVEQLIDLINAAPKPLLIHCEGGSDRSGLASAIALILVDKPLETSKQQFSFRYGVIYPHSVGKLVFARYDAWLQQRDLPHTKQNFLKWVHENVLLERHQSQNGIKPLFAQQSVRQVLA
jgi:protein tyrosine/serine phosphatase